MWEIQQGRGPIPEFALMSSCPDPINLAGEFDRPEKSKSSQRNLKSKGFESWIREWSSFPICFEFIVANEEAASGLSEHTGLERSLGISITFQQRVSRHSLQVNSFSAKHIQMSNSEQDGTRRETLAPFRLTGHAVWTLRSQGPICPSDWWDSAGRAENPSISPSC